MEVSSVRVHLVGHGHDGHRLLHGSLCLDHGDCGWEVEGINMYKSRHISPPILSKLSEFLTNLIGSKH